MMIAQKFADFAPPSNAEQAARMLPNSLSLVIPGLGHNMVVAGCLPDVVAAFLQPGTVKGFDISCIKQIQPAPFQTGP